MSTYPSGDIFSTVVSDIKNYDGRDPLRPWLQGIKKMNACLPPHVLMEKLPRFLQRCVQTFQSDRRYRNDSRYVGVWIQLMDFVEDPKVLLRMMERNQIGTKRAAYYMAYAIFYEKKKNFEEAENMYHLGVKNLAEPASELQKAYEQFLYRVNLHKRRRAKREERRENPIKQAACLHHGETNVTKSNSNGLQFVEVGTDDIGIHNQGKVKNEDKTGGHSCFIEPSLRNTENYMDLFKGRSLKGHLPSNRSPTGSSNSNHQSRGSVSGSLLEDDGNDYFNTRQNSCSDDTVVVKFVGSAIVGRSEIEDACHHGLVDPTINMKEAMNAISSMFREPLEIDSKVKRKTKQSNEANQLDNGFQVFVDEGLDQVNFHDQKGSCATKRGSTVQSIEDHRPLNCSSSNKLLQNEQTPFGEAFKILADDDDELQGSENQYYLDSGHSTKGPKPPISFPNANVPQKPSCVYEDTIIRRFVGSTIHDEPEVEDVCHHGLVDPTVNLKEAMEDINSMFGEPINFVRPSRSKKRENFLVRKQDDQGLSILADEDMEEPPKGVVLQSSSWNPAAENELFEPTLCTKEAMAEINAMFGMSMDF